MKISVAKFRRRWRAAQNVKHRPRREAKLDYLIALFGARPVYRGPGPDPVAWRLPTGDVFCRKFTYDTPQEARTALLRVRSLPGHGEASWYPCPTCGGYHLSSRYYPATGHLPEDPP